MKRGKTVQIHTNENTSCSESTCSDRFVELDRVVKVNTVSTRNILDIQITLRVCGDGIIKCYDRNTNKVLFSMMSFSTPVSVFESVKHSNASVFVSYEYPHTLDPVELNFKIKTDKGKKCLVELTSVVFIESEPLPKEN